MHISSSWITQENAALEGDDSIELRVTKTDQQENGEEITGLIVQKSSNGNYSMLVEPSKMEHKKVNKCIEFVYRIIDI